MEDEGKAGKVVYSQIFYCIPLPAQRLHMDVQGLSLTWPRQNHWFPLPNSPAFLFQIFQVLVNVSRSSAPKQGSQSFPLSFAYPHPIHQQVLLILSPKYIISLNSSTFSITTTMFQATIISYLPPCFNSCLAAATCLSQILSPCLLTTLWWHSIALRIKGTLPTVSHRPLVRPQPLLASSLPSPPSIIALYLDHGFPSHLWTHQAQTCHSIFALAVPLCLKNCFLRLKGSSFLRSLLVHFLIAHILALTSPLQTGLPWICSSTRFLRWLVCILNLRSTGLAEMWDSWGINASNLARWVCCICRARRWACPSDSGNVVLKPQEKDFRGREHLPRDAHWRLESRGWGRSLMEKNKRAEKKMEFVGCRGALVWAWEKRGWEEMRKETHTEWLQKSE